VGFSGLYFFDRLFRNMKCTNIFKNGEVMNSNKKEKAKLIFMVVTISFAVLGILCFAFLSVVNGITERIGAMPVLPKTA